MAVTIRTLQECKAASNKFSVLTAYDATFSRLISEAKVPAMLVGDSLGNVIQGQVSTVPVSLAQMVYHTECVARGNSGGSLILADVPFMAAATLPRALDAAHALMQAGANVVKFEGGAWLAETVSVLQQNGVPSCVHLGLTPQSVNAFGGYRVQGKDEDAAAQLLAAAQTLDEAGAALILLECVPKALGAAVTAAVRAPVIGIGAGPDCDGQVLVMHDMLGLNPRPARFVQDFMAEAGGDISAAFAAYDAAVRSGTYPGPQHCF